MKIETKPKKKDKTLMMAIYSLLLIGCVTVISASYSATKIYSVSNFHFALKHFCFCLMSLFLMNFFSNKSSYLESFGKYLWVISVIGLIVVLFFNHSVKGAARWINIFGFSFQPSEFAKIAVLLEGARFLEKNWNRFFITYLIPMALIIIQPDLGNTLLMLCLGLAQIITKKFNLKYIFLTGLIFILLIFIGYHVFDHVKLRIDIFLNLKTDIYGAGYQLHKSFLAMKSGAWFGQGFGKGIIKDFLPDAHTDFVFSVIVEEFGIFGGLFVIALFVLMGYRILKMRPDNEYFALIQYSFIIYILAQSWLNIASTLSLIPTKGLTLPFVSYGGSGLISQGIIAGILFSVSKLPKKYSKKIYNN